MDLDEAIMARIRAARALDKDARISDYQLDITDEGAILIHLKTGHREKICDYTAELSEQNRPGGNRRLS